PALHVKPPTMVGEDGTPGLLRVPAGFHQRAAAWAGQHPARAPGDVTQIGEVVVVEGGDDVIESDGNLVGVRMPAVARKVIERFGDNFSAMTMWLTFDETA